MTIELSDHHRIAKIERTFLGYEDHGICTAMLHVTYGGSGQGIGGYVLDDKPAEPNARRTGTAYGMEWIIRTLRACGVSSWEHVAGRTIIVYLEREGWDARPIGIGPLPTEPGEAFRFSDLVELFAEEVSR